ncbi:thioredoxin [Brucella ceti TE28753-12]|nr:thioredoxin [Brucella ceti TE10759-12]AHB03140.1 thioredoxin [Brucella ceti TE28753-12]ENR07621.1 hypothetical protein C068_02867 [Brucella sp. UK38/05]ENT08886.1 hypothetical protein C001_02341 [Brucella sp. F5/06]
MRGIPMTSQDNPYGGAYGGPASQMTANVSFGQPSAPANGGDLIKDTTTAGFQADV